MTQEIEIAGFHIPQSDWEATPVSVKALVTLLTNKAAGQALRPAVIWRKVGSQSQAGNHFVARMLTVTTSLKAQQRDVLEFLTQTYRAVRLGQTPPSLLPQVQTVKETETLIAA